MTHNEFTRVLEETNSAGPEWLRIPAAVRCYGISRTYLYELIREGSIKTALLRRRGNTSGIRLIYAASLSNYIERFASPRPEMPVTQKTGTTIRRYRKAGAVASASPDVREVVR